MATRKRKLVMKSSIAPQPVFSAAEIGSMLRARRKELGYTQEQVAEFLEYSPRLIGEIERGRATVGIQKVLDYAGGLGIDVTLRVRGS